MSVLGKLSGNNRLEELRRHRLEIFEQVFTDYCEGKCPASYVSYRAKKMLEIGLPNKEKKK